MIGDNGDSVVMVNKPCDWDLDAGVGNPARKIKPVVFGGKPGPQADFLEAVEVILESCGGHAGVRSD